MSEKKPLNIGLVGYGYMGRTHSGSYKRVAAWHCDLGHRPVLKAVCGRTEDKTKAFAEKWGYESYETDWRELIKRDDIDAIDICTPNDQHAEVAIAAAGSRQDGAVRKTTGPHRRARSDGGRRRGEGRRSQHCVVQLSPRARRPPPRQANHRERQTRPDLPLPRQLPAGLDHQCRSPAGRRASWRLDAAAAGSGVTGDLLAHCIDTAIWLNGSINDVSAVTETFIKERVHTATGEKQEVTIDDACIFHCHFDNGSLGLFESTRYARGHKALYTLEINGSDASIRWDLHDLNRLEFFDHSDESTTRGWRSVHITDGDMPYMDKWWVPGLCIGYEHTFVHQVAGLQKSLDEGTPCNPTFRDALETAKVCDAVLDSAKDRAWKDV